MVYLAKRNRGFSLVELLVVIAILGILGAVLVPAVRQAILSSSLATSASNVRQLAAGTAAYLSENNHQFWPYRQNIFEDERRGTEWWFGFEPLESLQKPEGERWFEPGSGPIGGYVPAGLQPDPSFGFTGEAFKPKYRFGYIGVGYNVLLGGGWMGLEKPVRVFALENPSRTVVFATSAQVNTFQQPASSDNPMIEEFYGFDNNRGNKTVHFRHRGEALVAFADSSVGYLEMEPGSMDKRDPDARVGRLPERYILPGWKDSPQSP